MTRLFLFFGLLGGLSGQTQVVGSRPIYVVPFPQLRAYLDLTDSQVSQISFNLSDYAQLMSQRQSRIFQVQSEIQQETAKSPLEPPALGVRYAAIESICRNAKDERVAVQNRNLALLTEPQNAKLKALDDAYKLFPIITEAQNAGILAPPSPYSSISVITATLSGRLGFSTVLPGCQQPPVDPNQATRLN